MAATVGFEGTASLFVPCRDHNAEDTCPIRRNQKSFGCLIAGLRIGNFDGAKALIAASGTFSESAG